MLSSKYGHANEEKEHGKEDIPIDSKDELDHFGVDH